MTTNHASAARQGAASAGERAQPKRARGSYRRQLTATHPEAARVGAEARRAAAVILEVLAGVQTPTAAAAALGIRLPRYYLWEQRAVQGLVSACAPRPRGRTISADRRLAQLERELAVARRELARHQALARTTQRALGLTAASPSTTQAGKAQAAATGPKRRRRRPTVRGLRAARLLRDEDCSGENAPPTVEQAVASPAGGGSRPAAMESSRTATQADHGGVSHAGRPKAVGNC